MALTTVTVTGKVLHPDKQTPCTGSVVFKPGAGLLVSAADGEVLAGTAPVTLASDGTFSVALPATDNTGTQPEPNTWNWSIEFRLHDAVIPPFSFALPSSPATVDLSRLVRVLPQPGTYLVVPGPEGPAGPKGDKGDPGPAGGVASVNGHTGVVVLGASDVGADTSGAAAAAQSAAQSYADAGDATTLSAANAYTDSHAGGGGGVLPLLYVDQIDAGIIVLANSATWEPVVGSNGVHVRRIIPNVRAGDVMQFTAEFLRIGTVYFLDGRILKADGSPSRYLSSGTATSGTEGYAPWYTQSSFKGVTGFRTFVVAPEEIAADGTWTIEMVSQSSNIVDNSNHLYFGDGYNGSFDVWHWPFGT